MADQLPVADATQPEADASQTGTEVPQTEAGASNEMLEELRKLRREAKDRRLKLEAYEAEEKKRKDAELSETQKAQARQAELEAQLDAVNKKLKADSLRHAVEIAAARANFINPEDVIRYDLDGVTVDDDGNVNGVDKALEALAKKRPNLIKTIKSPETDGGAGGGKPPKKDEQAAIARRFGLRGS